jgi:glycosyltransferase involved in cell wall biosynthesis
MKKHTIAINALSALQGGGQVYISNLLRYADKFPDIRIYVFAPPQFANLYSFPGIEVIRLDFASKNILTRTLWERWQMPRLLKQLEVNLVFCPGGTIHFKPPKGCKTAVTFQNMLIFDYDNRDKYPIGYRRFRLTALEKDSRKSFQKADLVIYLSEHSRKVIETAVPDKKGESVVIPHGLEERFRTSQKSNVPRPNLLPKEPYLLYVSYFHRIKAQLEVIRAFHILCAQRNTREKLLLVGPNYGMHSAYAKAVRNEIHRLALQDKIILMGEIPYSDMPLVYHHAKAHIFASTCENCPNIVIESLGSGRPLFLSNKASMPELAGDGGVYFDPHNPDELASLLLQNLDDQQWMKEMGKKAFERSFLYDWEKTAKETFRAFEELLEK